MSGATSLAPDAFAVGGWGMDGEIVRVLHESLSGSVADALFGVISLRLGFAFPLLAVLLAYLAWRHGKRGVVAFVVALLVLGLGDALGNGLKHLLAMSRPCFDLRGHLPWIPDHCPGAHRGMPSNHALNFFAVATFILVILREKLPGMVLVVVAMLVGLSRIYLGRHYPSQVLVGTALGICWGVLGAWCFGTLKKTALWNRFFPENTSETQDILGPCTDATSQGTEGKIDP